MTDVEQKRAYEIDVMLVVVPEIKQLSHIRDMDSSLAAQGVIKAYEQREPVFVTRDEIKGILKNLRYT